MLVEPLTVDPFSHTVASVLGWTRPPYPVEEALVQWLEAYAMAHRGKNKVKPKRMARPWENGEGKNRRSKPKRSEQAKREGRRKLDELFGLAD